MSNFEQEAYHNKVNAQFANQMYRKMVSARYGLELCGTTENEKAILRSQLIKKEEQDLNAIMDPLCTNDGLPNPEIPNGETILAAPPCASWTFDGPIEPVTEITYVPCGETDPVTEFANLGGTFCFETSPEPILTGVSFPNNPLQPSSTSTECGELPTGTVVAAAPLLPAYPAANPISPPTIGQLEPSVPTGPTATAVSGTGWDVRSLQKRKRAKQY